MRVTELVTVEGSEVLELCTLAIRFFAE